MSDEKAAVLRGDRNLREVSIKDLVKGDDVRIYGVGQEARVLSKAQGIRIMLHVNDDMGDVYVDEVDAVVRDDVQFAVVLTERNKKEMAGVRQQMKEMGF